MAAMWIRLFCLMVLILVPFPLSAQRATPGTLSELSRSFENLVQKVGPAVVQIYSTGYGSERDSSASASLWGRQRNIGSGVILDAEGYVVTNAHVIFGARKLRVLLADISGTGSPGQSILKPKGKMVDARLIGLDTETDLAVLKIQAAGQPHLELGNSDSLKPGQIVLAFGSPLGLENSVTQGVVSAVARQLRSEDPMIYIQTDAPINPGNSGGPLVDTEGRVVGINTLILSQSGGSEGIGFAAPSNIVRNVFHQIRTTGRVHRGEIGVHAQTITPELAVGLNLTQDWGVILGDVTPGSPAERAGLQIGDIVLSIDGKIIENGRQFDVNLYRRRAEESVSLEVLRGAERMTIPVLVVSREDETSRFAEGISEEKNLVSRLGVFCIDLDDEIAKLLPNLRKQYGVVVAARAVDAPYWAVNFRPGDIIHSVNGNFIRNVVELRSQLQSPKASEQVVLQVEREGKLFLLAFELE
jgi:serine protease Do